MDPLRSVAVASPRAVSRRDEVLRAARRVIVRRGLADTTVRDIAREGGFTTGVITHYFPDKRAVIFGALASAWTDWLKESRESFSAAQTPSDLLLALVEQATPDARDRQDEWRLWVEMWAYAGHDDEFCEQLVRADTLIWESELASVVRRLQEGDVLRRDLEPETEATIMNRLIDGLGLKAWLTGRWGEANEHFVMHLASLGLASDLVEQLLHPDRTKRQRGREP